MPRVIKAACAVSLIGAAVAGCQSAPARYAGEGASTIRSAGGEIYVGAGRALRQPFHDLNMLQDQIAPVLLRAESHPYDLSHVNSCTDVLNQVSELDLALGPDVDLPKLKRTRSRRGADFAAAAALDAAGTAAEHFIPMRSTIRQLTGAQRYDNHVKHAVLAGTTRRSFLKAVGMSHNCAWPAAPVDFSPTQPAIVDALWVAPAPGAAAMQVASVAGGPRAGTATVGVAQVSRVTLVSASSTGRSAGPVMVAVSERLVVPSAAPPPEAPSQRWRPALAAHVQTVALTTTTTTASAPWGQAFTTASAHP